MLTADSTALAELIASDPNAAISFMELAYDWKDSMMLPWGDQSSEAAKGFLPYVELSDWFLGFLNLNEKNWLLECVADDNYPFMQEGA